MNAPTQHEQLVDRARFLGGSDAAGVLGVSPWDTPLDIYFRKQQRDTPPPPPDRAKARLFRWGKLLEPVVIRHLRQDYGIRVTRMSQPHRPNRYSDPEHPFLAAEIDFEWRVTKQNVADFGLDPALIGTIQNGEIKTVHQWAAAKFGDAETEEVPVEYAAQAMHGLMVSGRKLTMFGVLTGTRDVTIYWIKRDEETIAAIRPQLVRFWHDHVLAGVPPEPRNLPDVVKLLRKVAPVVIAATPEVELLLDDLADTRNKIKQAEDHVTGVSFEIGKAILGETGITLGKKGKLLAGPDVKPGEHVITRGGQPALKVSYREQSRLDTDRLDAEHPEIVAAFQKQISFFTFNFPRKKS